ncbi:MAG: S1C family serine protease [Vicinamibacterales bacterium]
MIRASTARLFAWLAGIALALGLVVRFAPGPWTGEVAAQAVPREVSPRGPLPPGEQATIDLFEAARRSVVYITTQSRVVDLWTRNTFNVPRGTGSGFLWDDRGHVVTNHHVVAGASGAQVRLSDGRDVAASLVGVSPAHDLAVLRIEVEDLPPALPIGSSADLRVGQTTFAIGNPFGLDFTLTTGIVSALDRSLASEDGRQLIEHLIQTDAAINPGNSGGPLLDSAGRLIGVNTLIYSPSGASAGVGFSVPVDTVNRVVPQLIAAGKYVRPTLGVEVDEGLNRLLTERARVKGVAVLRVTPGSAAAAAGLRGVRIEQDGRTVTPGDIIVAVDGAEVESVARLLGRLDDHRVGDTVRLTVLRDGQRTEVAVTLQGAQQ